ncbi:acetylxylan esterase [Actinacidiphila sp. bgisy160]|uniref:acetylxylan esterase n=1 Tax=Actinacidiphila sp. bgisy160 TaxID=3413796 RepID=UPI003D737B5C
MHRRIDPERLFGTLDYFDGVHFAPRATAPAPFSVGLMDPACPPSTVFAAYNRYAGPRDITVRRFADHGGRGSQPYERMLWLRGLGLAPAVGR